MPVTEAVIKQVEEMAVKDGAVKGISFKDRKGVEYKFDNDKEYKMLVEPDKLAPFPDIPAEAPGMLTELEEEYGVDEVVHDEPEESNEQQAMMAAENSGLDFSSVPTKATGGEVIEILDNDEEDVMNEYKQEEVLPKIKPDQTDGEYHTAASEQGETRRSGQVRVANRQFEDYELYITVEEEEVMLAMVEEDPAEDKEDKEVLAAVAHYIMVHCEKKEGVKKKKKKHKPKSGQYQLEAGIKQFGEQGETAVTKELDQFNKYRVFEPKHARDLSEGDKKKALSSLIFLKEKKSGVIKAHSCANRNPQREHIAKEEAAVPTVALESVFITSTIDAKESRKVVTVNILGAFLHADNKDYVIMKMVGTLAELMVKTNPKLYQQYIILEKGRSVLYLQLQKALYGMMKSALLLYRKLVSELQEMGFEINPYDPCVANKTVNGTQMTIRWHVDDLMISHLSQDEIMKVVQGIKDIYGEILSETVGTMHDYLGMTFDYSFTKEVRINMWDYIRKVIKEFPKEITGVCAAPASDHLFKVQEDRRKLSKKLAEVFHHTVYQLLFAANMARCDIQTAVLFLTT
jgi:hypothetical protein